MAALHRKRFLRNQLAGVGVENACGAGIERGIDGEDQHGGMVSLITPSWPGLSRPSTPLLWPKNVDARHKAGHDADRGDLSVRNHTGWTSTTSGTKCRSRFWMPCRNVAVDDGQPEQAPFMLR